MMRFDAGDASGIAELFDPHSGRISFSGSAYVGRDKICDLYWTIFCFHANQEQNAKLFLLPDAPPIETNKIFIEKGEGAIRVYKRISAEIENKPINKMVAADIMVAEYVFPFKTFFLNQPRLTASDKIYFPILHLIVPTPTCSGNMSISAVTI